MNTNHLTERDICIPFITPAVVRAGWDLQTQILEEVSFTAGRIILRAELNPFLHLLVPKIGGMA